jgi:hypothetical protein
MQLLDDGIGWATPIQHPTNPVPVQQITLPNPFSYFVLPNNHDWPDPKCSDTLTITIHN